VMGDPGVVVVPAVLLAEGFPLVVGQQRELRRVGVDEAAPALQLGGSVPPNASGAMAMPQHLWHRTIASLCLQQDTSPARLVILQPASFRCFCHLQPRQVFDYTPKHHDDQGARCEGGTPGDCRAWLNASLSAAAGMFPLWLTCRSQGIYLAFRSSARCAAKIHQRCVFTAGSVYCIRPGCQNPHHWRPPAEPGARFEPGRWRPA
jgi:hypothetical protein